jgi:hypothetical protein
MLVSGITFAQTTAPTTAPTTSPETPPTSVPATQTVPTSPATTPVSPQTEPQYPAKTNFNSAPTLPTGNPSEDTLIRGRRNNDALMDTNRKDKMPKNKKRGTIEDTTRTRKNRNN